MPLEWLRMYTQPASRVSETIYSTDVWIRCQFPPNEKRNHRYTAVATKMLYLVQFMEFMQASSSPYQPSEQQVHHNKFHHLTHLFAPILIYTATSSQQRELPLQALNNNSRLHSYNLMASADCMYRLTYN
jgi:hypothetical protein